MLRFESNKDQPSIDRIDRDGVKFKGAQGLYSQCEICEKFVHKATLKAHAFFHNKNPPKSKRNNRNKRKNDEDRVDPNLMCFEEFLRPLENVTRKKRKSGLKEVLTTSSLVEDYLTKLDYYWTRGAYLMYLKGFRKMKKMINYEF